MQRWRVALLLLGFVESNISRDEKGIFHLGRVGISCSGQKLDGDGLFQLQEAQDPLQSGGGAAVFQHSTQHRNVLLHRGYRKVTIEDVTTALSLDSQIVSIMSDSSVAPLFDVNVSCANGNCDNVAVSIADREKKELGLDNIHTLFADFKDIVCIKKGAGAIQSISLA